MRTSYVKTDTHTFKYGDSHIKQLVKIMNFKWAASGEKHAQNAQIHIILLMQKVSSGPLLYTHTFC